MDGPFQSLQSESVKKVCVTNCWEPGDEQRFHTGNDAWVDSETNVNVCQSYKEKYSVCAEACNSERPRRSVSLHLEQWLSNIWIITSRKKYNLTAWSGTHTHAHVHISETYIPQNDAMCPPCVLFPILLSSTLWKYWWQPTKLISQPH